MTSKQFCKKYGIRLQYVKIKSRPTHIPFSEDAASHYMFVLYSTDGKFFHNGYYSQGSAHKSPPSAADILKCVYAYATYFEATPDLTDFLEDLEYNEPSSLRYGLAAYESCKHAAESLSVFSSQEARMDLSQIRF